jgi:rfaE bifunctional protein nucleotidyltransferase chain/domain/rfaE bifunctional protein kinase chain/domain
LTGRRIVVVGDALLDRDLDGACERLAPDAPVPVVDAHVVTSRPGGAALAATMLARDGHDVVLVTACADDAAARELAWLVRREGVDVVAAGARGRTAEKVRVRARGVPVTRLDYGGTSTESIGPLPAAARRALDSAAAVLVADYGRGMTSSPDVRDALAGLPRRVPSVWDPHPRGTVPVPGMWLATPNRAEARGFAAGVEGDSVAATAARARRLAREWAVAGGVAVTMGAEGALLVHDGEPPLVVPCPPATGDPCGAGDRFASAAAALLADGALPSEAVVGAVRAASAFVGDGGLTRFGTWSGAGTAPLQVPEREGPAGRATVVATGGCFDILHAGHVETLEGARRLGDRLVVLLNSDASVRRLKGEGRPINTAADRAAVLRALGCVDDVVVFDDDTPVAALERLRPDVFVKGGDYSSRSLPEVAAMAAWGGEVVVLPYVEGRSTSGLLSEVVRRGTS